MRYTVIQVKSNGTVMGKGLPITTYKSEEEAETAARKWVLAGGHPDGVFIVQILSTCLPLTNTTIRREPFSIALIVQAGRRVKR